MSHPDKQDRSDGESSASTVPDKRQAALLNQHYEALTGLRRLVVALLTVRHQLSGKGLERETSIAVEIEMKERQLKKLDLEIEHMNPTSKGVEDE